MIFKGKAIVSEMSITVNYILPILAVNDILPILAFLKL